jgi:hypothetical protein
MHACRGKSLLQLNELDIHVNKGLRSLVVSFCAGGVAVEYSKEVEHFTKFM